MNFDVLELKEFIDNYIRELVQADGGEISFISFENNQLTVKVQAECSKCPLTDSCFKDWLVQKVNKKFDINVSINVVKKKPYFWDI